MIKSPIKGRDKNTIERLKRASSSLPLFFLYKGKERKKATGGLK
jgi:hypothetical protein